MCLFVLAPVSLFSNEKRLDNTRESILASIISNYLFGQRSVYFETNFAEFLISTDFRCVMPPCTAHNSLHLKKVSLRWLMEYHRQLRNGISKGDKGHVQCRSVSSDSPAIAISTFRELYLSHGLTYFRLPRVQRFWKTNAISNSIQDWLQLKTFPLITEKRRFFAKLSLDNLIASVQKFKNDVWATWHFGQTMVELMTVDSKLEIVHAHWHTIASGIFGSISIYY